MQTILGAGGIIATEIAKELYQNYTKEIRLVSRNPKKVNVTDEIFSADLTQPKQAQEAVEGSTIVYLTVGLEYKSTVWQAQWVLIMQNVIDACKMHKSKLVFFDNCYMYGQVNGKMDENTPFLTKSIKGFVRKETANLLLSEMKNDTIDAVICRSPEFYGPVGTISFVNATVFDNIKNRKTIQVFLDDSTIQTMIYTPDAAKATALIANTPDAYHQTWHLPCDTNRLNSRQLIALCEEIKGEKLKYNVYGKTMIKIFGFIIPFVKESLELLYQWEYDYVFDCTKFNQRFPDFKTTTLKQGITEILTHQNTK
jgi:nucleoside-diphosphate-sugar epimerase